MQDVVTCLCAHIDSHKNVLGSAVSSFASGQKVGSWAANGILNNICDEAGKYRTDCKAKKRHVDFVERRLSN